MISITNKKKFSVISLVFLGIVALGIFRLVWGSGEIQKTGDVEIAQGVKAADVWRMLVNEGYSDRTIPWKYHGRENNAAAKIQAGIYHLEQGEKVALVLSRFVRGETKSDEQSVTFPEGFTENQVAARVADRQGITVKEFLQEVAPAQFAERFQFLTDLPKGRTLEGYLFPDTYRLAKNDAPEDIIVRMLANFNTKVTQELRDEAAQQKRTLDEIIIMASIIEKEVQSKDDMALVSGVLWKRIDNNEGLYTDATLEYIVNKDGELTVQDLAKDTPYNTRKYRGLPPGPISNPGLSAILAAIRPQKSDYYYYLTTKEGETVFAKTNDEHNRNKAKYL